MQRILITGASGFVGRHAMRIIREAFEGADILGVGRQVPAQVPNGVAFQCLDLNDQSAVAHSISDFRPSDVLHLAAQSSIVLSEKSHFDAWRINFGALYHLIDAIDRNSLPCNFIFASSGEVYGQAFINHLPVTEAAVPKPINTYAHSKLLSEKMLSKSLSETCIKPLILRPFNHIGPGQSEHFVISFLSLQIAQIEAGLRPPVVEVGNLSAKRDFLDVVDVVMAYVKVLQHAKEIPYGMIFNISSGQARSIDSILSELQCMACRDFEVRVSPSRFRPSEIMTAFGDSSRIHRAVGWKKMIDWPITLTRVLEDARIRAKIVSNR